MSDLSHTEDPFGLIGTRFGVYDIKTIKGKSQKSVAYQAHDRSLNRNTLLKILKPDLPDDRRRQFKEEGERLAAIGEHPNILTVYHADERNGYSFMAMEYREGLSLTELIEKGRIFNPNEVLTILSGVTNALVHANLRGHEVFGEKIEHKDIKLKHICIDNKNLEDRIRDENVFLVDWGGRFSESEMTNDVYAIGDISNELITKYCIGKVPKGLNEIIQKCIEEKYETVIDIKDAIDAYKKSIISRRAFTFGTVAVTLLVGSGLSLSRFIYQNSIEYVIDRIRGIDATDYEKIESLFRELALRICDQKIRRSTKIIPYDKFPYAISEDGNEWNTTDGIYWSDGFWPGELLISFQLTRDPYFKEMVKRWSNSLEEKIKEGFTEKDMISINPFRFYLSHAFGYDILRDEDLKEISLRALEYLAINRFNTKWKFLQMSGILDNSDSPQTSVIDTMGTLIPFFCWGYQYNSNFGEIIQNHCNLMFKININEDGSTVQAMNFNPVTLTRLNGVKMNSFSEDSCLARGQARAIEGFVYAYKTLGHKSFLDTAENLADYFTKNLQEDYIPSYDFKDPRKEIPKDSSAAAIGISVLLDLFKITSKRHYKDTAYQMLKSLSIDYLFPKRDYQGLILHSCIDINRGVYQNSSSIYTDFYFLRSLCNL